MAGRVLERVRTALALGPRNVARVAWYRLALKAGIHAVQRVGTEDVPPGPFFLEPEGEVALPAPAAWDAAGLYFGWHRPVLRDGPPHWHQDPLTGREAAGVDRPWWETPDFTDGLDIKTVWEASRLDWVVNLAQHARSGRGDALHRLNRWLEDWSRQNPAFTGPNWKCGQEASIRVMHLALGAHILGSVSEPTATLVQLLVLHLRRIAPTMAYAIAQDNNHGTSEAAALFIGGSWLSAVGRKDGEPWTRVGRAVLEERVQRLVAADGSFSQHSVNYHRLVLDTMSLCEVWRDGLGMAAFSPTFHERAAAAAGWLSAMVDEETGDAPNLGPNDGANLLPLTDADYRDFRPSVQVASALFTREARYAGAGHWDDQLAWLGIAQPSKTAAPCGSRAFEEGGYVVLRQHRARAILRTPRDRFRPGHADPLHLDLWVDGGSVLRDGGTYSYAADADTHGYFSGVRSHNTVQFDGREPMPRLGRFLWGRWINARLLQAPLETGDSVETAAAYVDGWGAQQTRRVQLAPGRLRVEDEVAGFVHRAVLRWRLRPGDWELRDSTLSDGAISLEIRATGDIERLELVGGWESRYYLSKESIPVLEVELVSPGLITSVIRWAE